MRLPLRVRVVFLVTAFNLAVFGGGLAWGVERLRRERAETLRFEEAFVRESLRRLLEVRGDRVAGDVLAWPSWERYEDALIVQLKEFEERFGLLPAVREAAETGLPITIPRGIAIPLRRPPPRTPPWVRLPLPVPWSPAPEIAIPWPRSRIPGPVWGAVFLDDVPPPPLGLPLALARGTYIGLPRARQREHDRRLGTYLRSILVQTRDSHGYQEGGVVVEVQEPGGVIHPLRTRDGAIFGAVYASWSTWFRLPFSPGDWRREIVFVGLPEFGFGPTLDASGLYLNPLGEAARPADFDEDGVLADLREAVTTDATLENERGLAVPLRLASGETWGGVWLAPREVRLLGPLVRELLPAFLLTTLLLTSATVFGMGSLVLEPVRRLAAGARRLAGGDLSARIPEIARRDELSELVRNFNAMAGQVEGFNARLALEVERATHAARDAEAAAMTQRRLAATGELAAGIAHEINNPLGGMLNALEVLRRGDLSAERRSEYLALVEAGLERIRETVGRLLRLAPRATETVSVSLADPLTDALALVSHRAAGQGTELVLTGEGGERPFGPGALEPWRALPPLRGQPNELGQAVLNLLVNALDAVEGRRGAVRVGMRHEAGEGRGAIHLWIEDDGPGMDPELLPRAADLFFTTKAVGRGTGLGLAVVHNVVAGHGGRVLLANVDGGGFRADVHLPLDREGGAGTGGGDPPEGRP